MKYQTSWLSLDDFKIKIPANLWHPLELWRGCSVLLLLIALSSRIDLVVQELLDLLKPLFFGEHLKQNFRSFKFSKA